MQSQAAACSLAQLTSSLAVASCGLLPRTTRPGPRVRTAFWSVASLPLRDTRESSTWSAAITECSVILSKVSLRAKSKDPHLVVSSAWVADPSQANVILSEASLRAKSKDPQLVVSSAWVADPSQAQDDIEPVWTRNVRDAVLSRAVPPEGSPPGLGSSPDGSLPGNATVPRPDSLQC